MERFLAVLKKFLPSSNYGFPPGRRYDRPRCPKNSLSSFQEPSNDGKGRVRKVLTLTLFRKEERCKKTVVRRFSVWRTQVREPRGFTDQITTLVIQGQIYLNLQQKRHVPLRGKDGAQQVDDNLDPGRIPGCVFQKLQIL